MIKRERTLNELMSKSIPILIMTLIVASLTMLLILSRSDGKIEGSANEEIAEVFLESDICELIGLEKVENDNLVEEVAEIYINSGGNMSVFDYFFKENNTDND